MSLPEEFDRLAREVSNWGRWGADDERGTLNLVTPEVVARGAACIRSGRSFSLAIPLSLDGPQTGAVRGRANPVRTMLAVNQPQTADPDSPHVNDDVVFMALQAATHWDAVAHMSYRGHLYNGFPADSVTVAGAARCGIDKVGVVTGRGVLLDVARARRVGRLEPGYPVTPQDLDAAEELAGLSVLPGDVVLVRTGHMQVLMEGDRAGYIAPCPGLAMATAAWFRARDVAAVATDTYVFEVYPWERPDTFAPLHLLHLVEMGLLQGENFDLEALAADCADDGVYEFFLEASPEPFASGLGGPVQPVAIK